MAPVRKLKSINKVSAALNDSSPSNVEKSKEKKRKVSDMLGPQWTTAELERFYEAYRKYNKNWKKVAAFVESRSTEMVQALYSVNRAYLSMPEGTASVSGLIAMMIDHYNVTDVSGSEEDMEYTLCKDRKVQKHQKAKARPDSKRETSLRRKSSEKSIRRNYLQRPSISSSDRSPSFLNFFDGIQRNVPVRKRTPRVPVSYLNDPSDKKVRGSFMTENRDDPSHEYLLLQKTTLKRCDHLRNPQPSTREKTKGGGFASDDSSGSYETRIEKVFGDSVDSGSALADFKKAEKGKNLQVEMCEAKMFDEACDAYKRRRLNEVFNIDGPKIDRSPSDEQRKRKGEHIIEDEQVACDALQTLSEMSLMMPQLATESVDHAREPVIVRDTSADRGAKCVKSPIHFKRRKSVPLKALGNENVKLEDSKAHISALDEQCDLSVKPPDASFGNGGHTIETEVAVSNTRVEASSHAITPTRRKSRRKRERTVLQKDRNYAPCATLDQDKFQCVEDNFVHCLSWTDLRRWCVYEWFYSPVDHPWFAKREFVEYLNHVGLGQIPRLTRVEWGVVRSSLGKPRRFSERFLQEERNKLKLYRESVRAHYANLRAGIVDGLPSDLTHPLSIGQKVAVIHPKTRELYNGCILAVDRCSCLVQFDQRDLGIEFVKDIDCMPLNPEENMRESHKCSQLSTVSEIFPLVNDIKVKQVISDSHSKVASLESLRALKTTESQGMAHRQPRKGDMSPIPCLTQDLDRKVFSHASANSGGLNGTSHYSDSSMFSRDETTSNVVEIVQGSREKAQKMVDFVVKVLSSRSKSEGTYERIGTFDASTKAEHLTNCRTSPVMTSSCTVQEGSTPHNPVAACNSEPQIVDFGSHSKPNVETAAGDMQVPSELITSCVGSLLMIKSCTERHCPPAEVAQVLDNAVSSLRPCCSQNLPVYREIQMCMGKIKTQILALIPT